jgi:hypothetical protein
MIYELAKKLGIDEHSLFGIVEEIARKGSTDYENGISMTWDRELFSVPGDHMMMEYKPSKKTFVTIYGPAEKVSAMVAAASALIDANGELVA